MNPLRQSLKKSRNVTTHLHPPQQERPLHPSGKFAYIQALQRTAGNQAVGDLLNRPVNNELANGAGHPLDPATRTEMESRFQHDFSGVRVHTDSQASTLTEGVGANAYTTGQDILFSHGAYAPNTQGGYALLAHELTHVVQQSGTSNINGGKLFSQPGDLGEIEAQHISVLANRRSQSLFPVSQRVPAGQVQGQWREKAGAAWERIKTFFGAEPDEEKLLKELNEGLERSKKLCELGAMLESNKEAVERLTKAGETFEGISKVIGKGLKITSAARDIYKFVDAIQTVEKIDIQKDPEKAAKAFGKLFAAAGNVGKLLPEGPWSAYFELLSGMEDFFTNMNAKINPEIRWKKQFEEIDKESR